MNFTVRRHNITRPPHQGMGLKGTVVIEGVSCLLFLLSE